MLQLRVEGGLEETLALFERMRSAGIEVQPGTAKRRREGFTHTYAVARLVDEPADERPLRDRVRVPSTTGRALPSTG